MSLMLSMQHNFVKVDSVVLFVCLKLSTELSVVLYQGLIACALSCKFKMLNVFILNSSCCCTSGIDGCPQPSGVTQAYGSTAAQLFLSWGQRDGEKLNTDMENAQGQVFSSSLAADQVFQSPRANLTSSVISPKGSRVRPLLKTSEIFCTSGWE